MSDAVSNERHRDIPGVQTPFGGYYVIADKKDGKLSARSTGDQS